MADEYIKRKEAIVALHGGETVHIPSLMLADKRIKAIPAADVVERKRGEWISVEDRMPEEPFGCLLIVEDCEPFTGTSFPNYLPYFAGWDGERWNDADGEQVPFEVLYWMPLPQIPDDWLKEGAP